MSHMEGSRASIVRPLLFPNRRFNGAFGAATEAAARQAAVAGGQVKPRRRAGLRD